MYADFKVKLKNLPLDNANKYLSTTIKKQEIYEKKYQLFLQFQKWSAHDQLVK